MNSIVLIDDSRMLVKMVSAALATSFHVVGSAHNGNDGFELYQQFKPDLVLLDITMPECSGKECLSKIMNFDPNARVIMLSSIGDQQTIDECIALGARGFVLKNSLSLKEDPQCQRLADLIRGTLEVSQEAA